MLTLRNEISNETCVMIYKGGNVINNYLINNKIFIDSVNQISMIKQDKLKN